MAEWDDLGAGRGAYGRTALHLAACHEGEPHLERLVRSLGLELDALDEGRCTALHLAAERGCPAVVQTLARLGASLDLPDGDGDTPLDLAVLAREPLTLDALLAAGARACRLESLLEAAHMGNERAMQLVPPEARDANGQSLAHWVAAESDRIDLLPADVKRVDAAGMTPLHLARSAAMTRALLERGADVRAADRFGNTPLHWLGHFATPEQVQMLLDAGASQRARNSRGLTPLENALELSLHPAMELLGPVYVFDAEDLSEPGWSVTHYAAALGSASAIAALRAAGRLEEPSDDGFTVLDQARAFGCVAAEKMLSRSEA